MTGRIALIGIAWGVIVVAAGCAGPSAATPPGSAELPEPPARAMSRGARASEEDLRGIQAAADELVKRVEAGDRDYVRKLMDKASKADVEEMIGRVKRADLRGTFREHVVLVEAARGRLDYHTPEHFQVD